MPCPPLPSRQPIAQPQNPGEASSIWSAAARRRFAAESVTTTANAGRQSNQDTHYVFNAIPCRARPKFCYASILFHAASKIPFKNAGDSADENFFANSKASSIATFAGAVPNLNS